MDCKRFADFKWELVLILGIPYRKSRQVRYKERLISLSSVPLHSRVMADPVLEPFSHSTPYD